MRKLIFFTLTLVICLSLFSETIQSTYDFDRPTIEVKNGKSLVSVRGLMPAGEPGEPLLPAYPVKMLIPQFHNVISITVTGDAETIALDQPIFPAQQQYPLSQLDAMKPSFTNLRDDVASMNVFPSENSGNQIVGSYRGYSIYSVLLYPVRYLHAENAIEYYSHLEVTIETAFDPTSQRGANFVRKDENTLKRLQQMVSNPEAAYGYIEPTQDRDRDEYDYLVITRSALIDEFQPLVDYKNSLGIMTNIVSVEDVLSTSEGDDDQEKIRNYIINEYTESGIDYVLLAADDEYIPHRGFRVNPGSYDDTDIPSDLYYFNLDGSWNDDNDAYWGEFNEVDFYGEVFGGRASVDDSAEATNFVNKQLMYQTEPVVDELTNNALIGEDLGWTSWGMDYMEEIRLGCSSYGYTTVGIPDHIDVETLYDAQGTWYASQLFSLMNSGKNLIGHLGHCSTHYNMKFYNDDVSSTNITNNGVNHNFYIIYTQGCYCNAFDNRDTNGYYSTTDAISEVWNDFVNGPVCYVGNTRYGWGDGQATNGASQHLQREFYDALYGENLTRISEAQADSKDDTVPYLSANTVLLWSYFESTVLGDPTLDIWSDSPANASIDTDDFLPIGCTSIDLTVTVNDTSIGDMLVAAIFNGELIGRTTLQNGVAGEINFTIPPETPGTLTINVSGHNLLNVSTEVDVIAPDEAFIIPGTYSFIDDNNNQLGWNESTEMIVPASNVGNLAAEGVTATITTDCAYITLDQDEVDYGTVGAQTVADPASGFLMTVANDVPLGTVAEFTVTFSNNDDTWEYQISVPIQMPNFIFQNESFEELSGNGNEMPDPGELIRITTEIVNDTDFTLDTLRVYLSTDNDMVSITPDYLNFNGITPGDMENLEYFNITLSSELESATNIVFYMNVLTDRGYQYDRIVNLSISPFFDTVESDFYQWNSYVLETGTVNQWHVSEQNNHTVNGDASWKSGDTGNSEYENDSFAALQSPAVTVSDDSWLTFWHRMEAEISGNYEGYAYDGGYVEVSDDEGSTWTQIEPEGGYPYLSRGDSCHLPADTPLFSGDHDWEQVYFDLAEYAGQTILIRFVFQSDGNTAYEGWFIDDIQIMLNSPLVPPTNLNGYYTEGIAQISWESPDIPLDCFVVMRDGVVIAENVASNTICDDLTGETGTQFTYTVASVRGDDISDFSEDYILYVTSTEGNDIPVYVNNLWQNYPNPFNPETKIRFTVSEKQDVNLKVYNVRGQLVLTLVSDKLDAGLHEITWQGRNEHDKPVGSGVYFYRLDIGGDRFVKKMLLLK